MAAETPTRLAQLPGYDTAPDVYETPDLDDSTPTHTAQTSPRAASAPSDTSEEDDDECEGYGVSRRRLHPERARSRFVGQSRGVETRGVDLSDRVDGRRKGYRVRRGLEVEDEEEGLQARLARLKREVEECRALAAKEKQAEEGGSEQQEDDDEDEAGENGEADTQALDALSRLLAGIEIPALGKKQRHKAEKFHDALPTPPDKAEADGGGGGGGATVTQDDQLLPKISAFDTRLSALETTLGLLDTQQTGEVPLLPSLTILDERLAALTSATSFTSLEAASTRIAKLKADLQSLEHPAPVPTSASPTSPSSDAEEGETPPFLSASDASRLQSLYTLLPTLQGLAPTVPALITRLRSLRTLHGSAASAGADLDAIEQRQAEMDRELKMWREGLEKVEAAVKEADTANGRNGSYVNGWVQDLEGRVKALGK